MDKWMKRCYSLLMLGLLIFQAIVSPVVALAQETMEDTNPLISMKDISFEKNGESEGYLIFLIVDYNNMNEVAQSAIIHTNTAMNVNKIEDVTGVSARINQHDLQLNIPEKSSGEAKIVVQVDPVSEDKEIIFENEGKTMSVLLSKKEDSSTSERTKETTAFSTKVASKMETEESKQDISETAESVAPAESKETVQLPIKKKEKVQAKREAINLVSLFQTGDKFIQSVGFKVTHEGKEIDYTKELVPAEALISFQYGWQIPQHLLDERMIQAGDYIEFSLPETIKINPVSGNLVSTSGDVYGTYEVTTDGKIRWTFNKKVEEENDISGQTTYSQELKEESNAGDTTIKIPIDGGEQLVNIHVIPKGGNAISKQGVFSADKKSVRWEVSVNTSLTQMTNATVKDPLPEGLELTKLTIYPQSVSLDGRISVGEIALVEGEDYLYDAQTKMVTFSNRYAKTAASFRLVYDTLVKDSAIPFEGGGVTFKNRATLNDGHTDYTADATVTTTYGKLLEKTPPKVENNGSGQIYSWQIKLNAGSKNLAPGYYVKDTLKNDFLEFVEGSILVKDDKGTVLTLGEDYEQVISGKDLTITFPDGLDHFVTIDYKTKFIKIVDGSLAEEEKKLLNEVVTSDGYKTNSSGTLKTDGLIKSATVDYNTRKINWTIEINRFNYEMIGWHLTDTMSEGLTFLPESFKLSEKSGGQLVKDTDYTISHTDNTFDVAFIGELAKGTEKTYVLTYQTDFERRQGKFSNKAISYWEDTTGGTHETTVTKEVPVDTNYVIDATKGGSYNAQSKEITWMTIVNYNQDELKNATIVDPIIGDQEYVKDSTTLYEVTISSNGRISLGKEVKGKMSLEDKTVTAELPDGTTAYALVFRTTLKGKYIQGSYKNEATYTNGNLTRVVEASVTPKDSGKLALKSGQQDPENANYVIWQVTVNPSQSTLSEVTVVDEPSPNQVLDEQSISIYKTTVSTDGTITRTNDVLQKGKDYTVEIKTDSETGKQVATILFTQTIETSYSIEYRSLINSGKATDELTNKIGIKAINEKLIHEDVPSTVKVIVSGGSATGSKASVTLVKVDKDTSKPIKGASLELWSTDSNGNKQQLIRSGVTDEKGELKFGNLRANYTYLLFETNAPEGYTVSEELAKGKKLTLEEETETSIFQEVEIANERAKIVFKKVDTDANTPVQGAVFVVVNEEGQFYNGLNEKGMVEWVDKENDIHQSTKDALTSNKEGIVEVVGLSPGEYKTKEVTAPTGYRLSETAYTFTVEKDDQGFVKLTVPLEAIKNKRKTMQIDGEKIWKDYHNKFQTRPDSITVHLYRNDVLFDTKEVKERDGEWTFTFDELFVTDEFSVPYEYRVEEEAVKNYEASVDGWTITNTYMNTETTQVQGQKLWEDYQNKFETRPESITVRLRQNGEVIKETTVKPDQTGDWLYTFTELPKYDEKGDTYEYTVTEVPVENYEATIEGTTITNTYRNMETTELTGEKYWEDYENKFNTRPENITVQLRQNGEVIKEATVKPDQTGKWGYTFTELPKYDEKGDTYEYTVSEIPVENYETAIEGTTITNTYKKPTEPKNPTDPKTPTEPTKLKKPVTKQLTQQSKHLEKKLPKTNDTKNDDWVLGGSVLLLLGLLLLVLFNKKKQCK